MSKFCLTFCQRSYAALQKTLLRTAACSLHLQPSVWDVHGKVHREIKLAKAFSSQGQTYRSVFSNIGSKSQVSEFTVQHLLLRSLVLVPLVNLRRIGDTVQGLGDWFFIHPTSKNSGMLLHQKTARCSADYAFVAGCISPSAIDYKKLKVFEFTYIGLAKITKQTFLILYKAVNVSLKNFHQPYGLQVI